MATLMTIPDVELVLSALRRLEGSRQIPSRPADIAIDEAIKDLRKALVRSGNEGIAQREEYGDE